MKKALVALLLALLCATNALAESAVITQDTRVYKKANKSSASVAVKKGTKVELLATRGGWAWIERNGVQAYMNKTLLAVEVDEPDYGDPIPARITANTRVYKKASTSSASRKVAKGMQVNLLDIDGSWALIQRGSTQAYIQARYIEEISEPTDAYITADTRVYKKASTSSASRRVAKGMKVSLIETDGSWALIANGSTRAYIQANYLSDEPPVTATPSPTAKPTPEPTPQPTSRPTAKPTVKPESGYLDSDKYSNEQKCYLFMVNEMDLSSAAACGILANLRKESNFNPTAGSSYYGLVQWGGGRKSNLISFCEKNGYGHDTIEGQMNFLEHELKNSYSSVWKFLKDVPDTAQGAYDAAYHFCYYYERPSNKAEKSASRGELARDTYFPKYN